jgi:hypothetical protein
MNPWQGLAVAPNGVTICATKPKAWYEGNRIHRFKGKDYRIVVSKDELEDLVHANPPVDLSAIVTTFITDFSYIFLNMSDFNHDISNWDVRRVKDFTGMFEGATSFCQDLSHWNPRNARIMDRMFENAICFTSDLSHWNVRQVHSMCRTFKDATRCDFAIEKWDINPRCVCVEMLDGSPMKSRIQFANFGVSC